MRPAPFTSAAIAEAGQAVKSGAGQDRAGCSRTGQPGNDALEQREAPGEQLAYSGGRAPVPPKQPADQQRRLTVLTNSLRETRKKELVGTGSSCCPRAHPKKYKRRSDGRAILLYMPCRARACPWCGGRRRAERLARDIAHALGNEPMWAWTGPTSESTRRFNRRTVKPHRVLHVPAPDGQRVNVVSRPCADSAQIADLVSFLVGVFEAQPNDSRRYWLLPAYRQVLGDLKDERKEAFREEYGECEGEAGVSMEEATQVAVDLDVLASATATMIVLKPMDRYLELRFNAKIKLRRGWARREAA